MATLKNHIFVVFRVGFSYIYYEEGITMKIIFCLLLCLCSILTVFAQNMDEITLSYQDEVELWLIQNAVHIEAKVKRHNDIELFMKPDINPKYPAPKYFGRGGSVIECFAVGKFLTSAEKEGIYTKAYNGIPVENKRTFEPFKTYENFRKSLIFNPNMLLSSYFFNIRATIIIALNVPAQLQFNS